MKAGLSSLWAIALAGLCLAQTQTATVRGFVSDASGAMVPNASLTLTNVDQNRPWTARSNIAGEYTFVQIPPGRYSLSVQAAGFKKYEQGHFTLEVAQIAAMGIVLQVGAVTETVQVTAEAPILETASSTLGEVVNSRTTENLPLNGRNVLQLVHLTPGINTTRSYRTSMNSNGNIAAVGFSANGGRNVSNTILVDGSPQEVMGYNQAAFIPSPDAVQEFKVQTNALSAEYGRTGGAVVNVVHRSGTSAFHGVLYEFLRNDTFDANTFFDNRNGVGKGAFRFNQFGATVGGPLSPSRRRTFFFFNYEGLRQVNPGGATFTVPTARMKRGDFSEVADVIYDPLTIDAAGVRREFADKQIPAQRLHPAALKILSFYPEPTGLGVINNFYSQAGGRPSDNTFSTRLDHRISDRQNIFGRLSWNNRGVRLANHFRNVAAPNTGVDASRNRSATLDDTYSIGGWVLHGNYGYAYHTNPRRAPDEEVTAASLGLPAKIDAVSQFKIFPRIEPSGYASLGGDATWVIGNKFETHTATGDVSRLVGRHTVKFGGTHRLNRLSNFRPNSPAGLYAFNDGWTRRAFNRAGGGNAIASMLLGLPGGGRIQFEPPLALQVKYVAGYVQDDWRVSDRLTLNAGLRWDSDRPLTERFDRTSSFDFDAVLPVQAPGLGPLRGGLVFAGRGGRPRGSKDPDNNNFAPRVGLAYRLTQRVVVRSGFGIFFNPTTGIGPSAANSGALSYNANTPITSSIDGGRTPFVTLSDPFPNGFNQPENGSAGLLTFIGQGIQARVRSDRTPYSAQWNFNIQYSAKDDTLVDVAYAGNAGVKLLAQADLNQLPDDFLALRDAINETVSNPLFGIVPATAPLGQATTTRGQLLRPFPHFTGVTHVWGSEAHSSYHALQAKFRKRYRGGLQMLAAYTWSKTIDDVSSVAGFLGQQNPDYTNNNKKFLDKSLSALDVAHRFVVNFQYELPFGRGKPFLNSSGVVHHLAGAWSISGIGVFQSGLPISISSRQNTTFSFGGDQRPDSTGISSETAGGKKERIDRWFNPAAFIDTPAFTFGNVGRLLPDNRGPYLHEWDIAVMKDISLRERWRLQFRAEFFNIFNQVNLDNPAGTTFGQPNFGRITGSEDARIIQFGLKLYY